VAPWTTTLMAAKRAAVIKNQANDIKSTLFINDPIISYGII
jgi:hypothetical protein